MSEKPLHVQVAEAIGWTEIEQYGSWSSHIIENPNLEDPRWYGKSPLSDGERERFEHSKRVGGDILLPYFTGPLSSKRLIPRLDEDWFEIGPLIEKHWISLYVLIPGDRGQDGFAWGAAAAGIDLEGLGFTPLLAVCNLILAMKEAGKL